MASNNLPGIGHNEAPDYAKLEVERLQSEYPQYMTAADELIAEAGEITAIEDDEKKEKVVDLIKRIRDLSKRIIGVHELEKQPHLRRGQGVDNFFFGLADKLMKRAKPNKDGAGDNLGKLLTAYDARKLAEEQERRRLEAERLRREEEERRRIAAEEARKAEDARLAAERARKPETAAVKQEVAAQAEQVASAAAVDLAVAAQESERAHVETLTKPADIMRTRTESGTLSTMAQEPFAEIIDRNEMLKDAAKLWAYLPPAALQTALNGYARANAYSADEDKQIAGARIGKRAKSVVR